MNCSPTNLASQAACYKSCLDRRSIAAIKNFLLCSIYQAGGIGANLVPSGASYSGGGTYTLAVGTLTTYSIMWGANDTSMQMAVTGVTGGQVYTCPGAGQTTTVYSSGYNQFVFTGTGGSTVTAMVRVEPKAVPILTGLAASLNSAGTVITVSWDAPPAVITGTNVYTSPDQVTWTLAATVTGSGTSTTLNGPSAGTVTYIRAYWFDGIATNTLSPLTVNQPDVDAAAWATRVVSNGGALVSRARVSQISTFCTTLKATTVWNKLQWCNPVAPDSLTAAETPLIVGNGSALWAPAGVVTLSSSGIKTDGNLGSRLVPGNLGVNFTTAAAGIVLCASAVTNTAADHTCGNNTSTFSDGAYMFLDNSGNTQGALGSPTTSSVSFACPGAGYFSLQRTANNALNCYWGNSTNAHASKQSQASVVSTLTADEPFPYFGSYQFGTSPGYGFSSSDVLSFMAGTTGLSSSEDATLFTAVQTLRTAFGGGFP